MDIRVGDLTFPARTAGPEDGELVILLHGFPQSSAEWSAQLPALAAAGYHAVAPDQRGYAASARPAGVDAYHVDHLVADTIGMADALGAERFHLVGHDWGAIVAWYTAAQHPDRLASLTIVSVPHPNAFARALDPASGTDQPQKSAYITEFRKPEPTSMLDPDTLHAMFIGEGIDAANADAHRELLRKGAIEGGLNWYRAFDFHAQHAGDIEVPTLFVWGSNDVALGREGAEWTAEYVRAPYRFVPIEGASHWIPETEVETLNTAMLEHLASCSI